MSKSITHLRKWNLVAGGIDPRNDVIPASVGYGLEDALDFAMIEILRLQDRCKRLEEAGDALAAIIGPPGSEHWADENQVDAAWNNWLKAKEAK